jgi:hypothetical protein
MSGIIAQNTLDNSGLIKSPAGGGAWNFIKKLTASGDADLSFVDGTDDVVLDDTYKEYVFTFNNIHPETDGAAFTVGFRDGGSAYDATKTTTYFFAQHNEADDLAQITYRTGDDLAQSTSFQGIYNNGLGADNDQSVSGTLHLYNPSSTTFVKHFLCEAQGSLDGDVSLVVYVAGYCNVTAAIDGVQFKMASDNIDAGDICLYGITT